MEKASGELVTISYSLRGIKAASLSKQKDASWCNAKIICNRNWEWQVRSLSSFKMDYTDGKRTGPPLTIKHQDRHSPKPGRNQIARSWEETLKHRLTSASYTHKHSQAFFSGQTQGARTQVKLAFSYSSFLKAPCYTVCILISKLNTPCMYETCPLITPLGKCFSRFKVIFIFQFVLALPFIFHYYLLHLIALEGKNEKEKSKPSSRDKGFWWQHQWTRTYYLFFVKGTDSLSWGLKKHVNW